MSKPQLIYHQLDEPFFPNPYGENSGISALHDLYPGRPLTTQDGFNEYEIMPEDPEGAKRTFINSTKETKDYAKYLVARTIADGAGKKVTTHSIDDPSIVVDNVNLKNAQMMIPETMNEGNDFSPKGTKFPYELPNAQEINAFARGRQNEGNARSEGMADNPEVPYINTTKEGQKVAKQIEGFDGNIGARGDDHSIQTDTNYIKSDSALSYMFFAVILILLILALGSFLRR